VPENAKPAEAIGGHREIITVRAFRPHPKNSLVGFFDATLPSGLILRDLMLHERNGARWVSCWAREWTDAAGEKHFAQLIQFRDRRTANKFRRDVLDALDKYLKDGAA
jgi:hypothetical protein